MDLEINRMLFRLHEMGFDAIQFLGSYMDGGKTICRKLGVGNFYARRAMCQEFIEQDLAQDQAAFISDAIGRRIDPPDDGESWKKQDA